MNINYELYKVFYYAAKQLNFSKAADDLFITQSAVSQSIKQLENQLETMLFLRHGRNIKLTSDGEVLFKHIEQAYHLITSGEKQIFSNQNLDSGELHIGASDTICKHFLLPYIKQFHSQYPGVKIQIINQPSPMIFNLVEQGRIDIGIVNTLPDYSNTKIKITNLMNFKDIFIASEKYLELSHGNISLDELSSYPLISLGKNSTTRLYFDQLVRSKQLQYEPEIELGSIDLIIEMVEIGLGVGFVSDYASKEQIKNKSVFEIKVDAEIPLRTIGIINASNLPMSSAALAFSDILIRENQ